MGHRLKTLGHATLLLFEDGNPLIATDPWLLGSAYWRSWWLEKYPTEQELADVKRARHIYITHSHPDHFHYPTLRHLGKPSTLHPHFPKYEVIDFLSSEGYPVSELDPWRWHEITERVKIASIPSPIDDSILIINAPTAYIVNVNDAVPLQNLLRLIRSEMLTEKKPVLMLKSYSPASIASAIYREGKRTQMKTKRDYAETAQRLAASLGATHFIPFASQAFFNRADSKWANEYKVTYEDVRTYWTMETVTLCEPFVDIDLDTMSISSDYPNVNRSLDPIKFSKVTQRESEERNFDFPSDFGSRLEKYMSEIYFLSLFFRRGIGWRLTTSGREYFYNTRSRRLEEDIPENYDVIISLPDQVLYESLQNNVLTDLGITMFLKVETRVSTRFTYGLFLMMGLHDYGYFSSATDFGAFLRFYAPYFVPSLMKLKWLVGRRPSALPAKNSI